MEGYEDGKKEQTMRHELFLRQSKTLTPIVKQERLSGNGLRVCRRMLLEKELEEKREQRKDGRLNLLAGEICDGEHSAETKKNRRGHPSREQYDLFDGRRSLIGWEA